MRALAIGIDRAAFGWLAVVPRDGPIALFPRGTAKTLPPGPHALLAPMSGHYNKLLWPLGDYETTGRYRNRRHMTPKLTPLSPAFFFVW